MVRNLSARAAGHFLSQDEQQIANPSCSTAVGGAECGFCRLGYRLVDLQVLRHDELSAKAEQNTQREYRQAPRRGDILDVNGNILATSIAVKTICADPSLIGDESMAVANVIAPLLQLDKSAIAQKLMPRSFLAKNSDGETVTNEVHYVRLAKNVPDPTWQQIYAAMTNYDSGVQEKKLPSKEREYLRNLRQHAIFAEADQLRVYPDRLFGQPGDWLSVHRGNESRWPVRL